MDGELKKKAYLEGLKLKNSGLEQEVIYARLEKQGFPEELAKDVAKNVFIQRQAELKDEKQEYNRIDANIGIAMLLFGAIATIVSLFILPYGVAVVPFGLIIGGIYKIQKNKN